MNIGWGETVLITLVLVTVFSASRMSALGNALGKFVESFRAASAGGKTIAGRASVKRNDPPNSGSSS